MNPSDPYPANFLAAHVLAGSRFIYLATPMEEAPAVRIGDPAARSYEIIGVHPDQGFPAALVRLRGSLRMSYALGEPVCPVMNW